MIDRRSWGGPVLGGWILWLVAACSTTPGDDAAGTVAGTSADTGLDPIEIDDCELPTHVVQAGVDPAAPTGFVRCNGGTIRRVDAVECQSPVPTGTACSGQSGTCADDADCGAQPHGACLYVQSFFSGCECVYGCATDADCDEGMICICGGSAPGYPASTVCAPASCTTDMSCDSEQCVLGVEVLSCGEDYRVGCRTPEDTCSSSGDCQSDESCLPGASGEPWSCMSVPVC